MKRLENLPEATDELLGGLHASQALKNDIIRDGQRIREGGKPLPRRSAGAQFLRTAAAMTCLVAFVVGLLVGIPSMIAKPVNGGQSLIDTQTGGALPQGGQAVALDMHQGSVVISQRSAPSYRGVWEAASGANFPLICVNGRYYRMMSAPSSLSRDLLGGSLGAVDTYTSEPALANGGIVSNIAPQGETVYAVSGMGSAAVAAQVNGSLRVFQRVSYGNSGPSGESLADTLGGSSAVALELTGVGTVTDPAEAQRLLGILLSNASLTRAGAAETGSSLLIGLQNGLVLQMSVRDESLMACGTWSCPAFFEAFEAAVR